MENIEESMDDSFEDETWKPQTNENDYSKDSSNGESDSDQSERAPRGKCTIRGIYSCMISYCLPVALEENLLFPS